MTSSPSTKLSPRRFHRLAGGAVPVGILALLVLSSSGHFSLGPGFGLGLGVVSAAEMTGGVLRGQQNTDDAAGHPDHRDLQKGGGGGRNKNPPTTPAPVTPSPTAAPVAAPVAGPTTPTAPPVAGPTPPPVDVCGKCANDASVSCSAPGQTTSECGVVGTTTINTCSKTAGKECTSNNDCSGNGNKCNQITQVAVHGMCEAVDCTDSPTKTPSDSPSASPTATLSMSPSGKF